MVAFNQNTILKDDDSRNIDADDAEFMVQNYLGAKRVSGNHSCSLHDLEWCGHRIDVKTKRRTVDPLPSYSVHVESTQIAYPVDIYVFCSKNKTTGKHLILGWITKNDFNRLCTYHKKGDQDGNFVERADCYKVKISELKSMGDIMSNGQGWIVSNKEQGVNFCDFIMDEISKGNVRSYNLKSGGRTGAQNAALHACLRRLAEGLNESGFGIPHPFKPELEIPWTDISAKELLYKPIIKSMFDTDSSTELTKEELTKSVDIMLGRVGELTGLIVGFTPQEQALLNSYQGK